MTTPPTEDIIEDVEKEVEEFLEEFTPPEPEPEPEPEEPVEEPAPEEPPEEVVEEEVVEELPPDPRESEPEEPPVEETPEADPRDEEIAKLRQTIADMGITPAPGEEPAEAPPEPQPREVVPEPTPDEFGGIQNLDELEDVTSSVEAFNSFIGKVIDHAKRSAVEDTWRTLPQVVHRQVIHQSTMKEAVDDFYRDNEDLKPFRAFVGSVTAQVVSEKPDATLGEVFGEVEKRARDGLQLKKRAVEPSEPPARRPAFAKPKGGGTRRKVAKPKGLQDEVLDLIED